MLWKIKSYDACGHRLGALAWVGIISCRGISGLSQIKTAQWCLLAMKSLQSRKGDQETRDKPRKTGSLTVSFINVQPMAPVVAQ